MQFSKRTGWNLEESELARAHRERIAAGVPIFDLTASNPTRCGFDYAEDLLDGLADPASLHYDPNPLGSLPAREAVAAYYASHKVRTEPSRILLTTSTSEAYGFLFKLICDPGHIVLTPRPSYPLFDYLASAEAVSLAAAPLVYDFGWQLEIECLRRQITPETRAIVLVHPNNPTGHFTTVEQSRELAAICREHGLALIVDEVFLDYALDNPVDNAVDYALDNPVDNAVDYALDNPADNVLDCEIDGRLDREHDRSSFLARPLDVPLFVVSGISKICGLPQMKAAWLVAAGPGSEEAMARLETISDAYLSMNGPVQRALPGWLAGRARIQDQIHRRVRGNLAELDRQLAAQAHVWVNRLRVEGGWYAILRVPATQPDETTARELLHRGVWVHPGYFFGFAESGWLVVSLLAKSDEFSTGITVLLAYFRQNQESYPFGDLVRVSP